MDCMSFPGCGDLCCRYGVDVSSTERAAIQARGSEIAHLLDGRTTWFEPEIESTEPDDEFPDGLIHRTLSSGAGCAFLNPRGRGCVLHALGLKPRVCSRSFFLPDGRTLDEDVEWLPCKPLWFAERIARLQGGPPSSS